MSEKKSSLEINNLTNFDVSEDFFNEIFENTVSEAAIKCLRDKRFSLSAALVEKDEIAGINLQYRKRKDSTDVLSFPEYAKIEDLCHNGEKEIFLGEIILCPEYIKRSSREQKVSFSYEMAYIFSHGILHLLGFRHGKKMFSIQEKIAEKIKNKS